MIKKLVIYGVIAFAAYQGASMYTTYSLASKVSTCGARYGMLQDVDRSKLTRNDFLISAKTWRCVKREQNVLEALFFRVPDGWINPTRPYVDPPFSPEELADGLVIDEDIQKDLQALAKAYEGERARLNKISGLLNASGGGKVDTEDIDRRYARTSEEFRLVASKLSELQLRTREVETLHREVVDSMNRIGSSGQELKSLHVSAKEDLAEVESILALPKNAIAEHRVRLFTIRDRLTRTEIRLQNVLEAVRKDESLVMAGLDALEALSRKHGVALKLE